MSYALDLVRRVLIVDDNPDIRDFMYDALTEHVPADFKFDVKAVSNGRDAVAEMKASVEEGNPFCIAFVDQRLPGGESGVDVIVKLWQLSGDLQVVIITAYNDFKDSVETLRKLGDLDKFLILKKPLNIEEIIQTTINLSQKWTLERLRRIQAQRLIETNKELERSLKELKQTQDALIKTEKLAAVGRLAAGVAHEFNNILTGLLGYAQLALSTRDIKDMENALNKSIELGWRAKKIVDDLLNFSRQKPKMTRRIYLHKVLDNVIDLIEKSGSHNIKIIKKYEDIVQIEVDEDKISQVFLNIMLNAQEAIGRKKGEIRVYLRKRDEDYAEVEISDTGPGIPEDVMEHIFEPFFTTKGPSIDGTKGGTGLGLAIVLGIVEGHGGKIMVDSEVGKGATFRILLPIRQREGKSGNRKVVVLEKDRFISDLIKEVLKREDYEIVIFSRCEIHAFVDKMYAMIIDPVIIEDDRCMKMVKDVLSKGIKVIFIPALEDHPVISTLKAKYKNIEVITKPFSPEYIRKALL